MVGMWRGAAIGCLLAGAWQLLLLLFLWHRVISPEVVEDLIKSKRKARRPDRSSAGRATIVDADGASSAGSAIVPHGSSSHAEGDVGARRRARERERRRRSLRKGFILWQQSLRGMVDLATDLLFLLVLRADGEAVAYAPPLLRASASLLASALLFNLGATLSLYFSRVRTPGQLRHQLFDLHTTPSSHRAAWFGVVLSATLFNVRLSRLFPWTREARPAAERLIQRIHLASRCCEDLPQLVIAAIYLSLGGGTSSESRGAAALQLLVSGTSFGLALLFLCLQVADTAIASPPTEPPAGASDPALALPAPRDGGGDGGNGDGRGDDDGGDDGDGDGDGDGTLRRVAAATRTANPQQLEAWRIATAGKPRRGAKKPSSSSKRSRWWRFEPVDSSAASTSGVDIEMTELNLPRSWRQSFRAKFSMSPRF